MSFGFQFPNTCSRCASNPPSTTWEVSATRTQHYVVARRTTTYRIKVPICQTCLSELKHAQRQGWIAGLVTLGIIFLLAMLATGGQNGIIIGVVGGIILGIIVGTAVQYSVAAPNFAQIVIQHGTPTLRFKNPQYNSTFQQVNGLAAMLRRR